MKTLATILFISILSATFFIGIPSRHTGTQITYKETAIKRDQFTNNGGINTAATSKNAFMVYLGRYTSYFRTFMPFDEDPCNHLSSRKSFC